MTCKDHGMLISSGQPYDGTLNSGNIDKLWQEVVHFLIVRIFHSFGTIEDAFPIFWGLLSQASRREVVLGRVLVSVFALLLGLKSENLRVKIGSWARSKLMEWLNSNSGFCLFSFFSSNTFTRKSVDFRGIQTVIVGREGKHADHLTTTTTHFFYVSMLSSLIQGGGIWIK